jgi:hypothetical protein
LLLHYLGLTVGLASGEIVAVGEGGGGGAVFMFVNNVRNTAAMVLVIASTCALTCCSGTLL